MWYLISQSEANGNILKEISFKKKQTKIRRLQDCMILTDKIRHSTLTLNGDFKCPPNIRKNIIKLDSKRIAGIYFYHFLVDFFSLLTFQ